MGALSWCKPTIGRILGGFPNMKRNLAGLLGLTLLTLASAFALERPDKEFAIFQFPPL